MLSRKPPQKFLTLVGITSVAFGLSIVTEFKLALADRIGYLGPQGTYSEQATKVYQSKDPSFDQAIPYNTITAVTNAIKTGDNLAASILFATDGNSVKRSHDCL